LTRPSARGSVGPSRARQVTRTCGENRHIKLERFACSRK
jgi:hypothetical protein